MKTFLLLLLTCYSYTAFSQIDGKKEKGAITILDSIRVAPGDTLYFGNGSDMRGDFVYVYQPPNFLLGMREEGLSRKFSNKFSIVKHFKNQKDKRTGDKTVAVINPFGGLNYVADLEGAIKAGEILAINGRSFAKKEQPPVATVVVQKETSIADELTKLKKLMDDGIETKDEFEAQKKKLLEKN